MTSQQEKQIATLTRKLGLGSYASYGIKRVLGKVPVNMTAARAESVIAELQEMYDESPAGQAEKEAAKEYIGGEDMPMRFARRW